MIKIIIFTIINSMLMATGQILWKIGVSNSQINNLKDLLLILMSPYILFGLVIYGFTTLLWLYILSRTQISYVYPIQSLVFIFVLLASMIIFKEDVGVNRWVGVFVICFGVYLVSIK